MRLNSLNEAIPRAPKPGVKMPVKQRYDSPEAEEINSIIDNEGGLDRSISWGLKAGDIQDPAIRVAWQKLEMAVAGLERLGVGYRLKQKAWMK